MLPDEVTVHGARMALESVTAEELDAMSDDAARAAELLGHADVDDAVDGPGALFDRDR